MGAHRKSGPDEGTIDRRPIWPAIRDRSAVARASQVGSPTGLEHSIRLAGLAELRVRSHCLRAVVLRAAAGLPALPEIADAS